MEKKNWLITGISSGLGRAIAQSVMEKGDFVIGTFRNQNQVDNFNLHYEGKGFSILLDITNEKEIEHSIEKIIVKYGKIDVLVNNAGFGFVGAIEETSIEEVRNVFEPNFFGSLKLTQTVLPFMRKEKNGYIVQISSQAGIKSAAGFGIYNASKYALEGFSEALAEEIAPLGIKLSIIEPGPFRTNFAGKSLSLAKEVIDDYSSTAGSFRKKLQSIDGKQEGDPNKAAEAIIELVNSENPTLRLALGKIAIASFEMKIKSLTHDLNVNRSVSENAIYKD